MKQNNQITKRNLFQGETFQMIMPKLAAQVVLFDKLEMNLANKRNMDFMDCKRLLSLMLIPEKPRMNFCIVIVLYWIWFSKAKFEISCFSFSIMIPDHWILLSTNSAALLIFFSDFFQRTTGKSDLSEFWTKSGINHGPSGIKHNNSQRTVFKDNPCLKSAEA